MFEPHPHLGEAARRVQHEFVWQHHRERLEPLVVGDASEEEELGVAIDGRVEHLARAARRASVPRDHSVESVADRGRGAEDSADAEATRAAAEAAKGPRGTVVESFGKVWLYTIAEKRWRPVSGKRIAVLGPFPVVAGKHYTARYMEAVFTPGMRSMIHRHSGPEAWYLVSGVQCLETPTGITVARAGESTIVPEGPAMALSSVGTETRRSVVLVLHDSSLPWVAAAHDWQPKGLCPK